MKKAIIRRCLFLLSKRDGGGADDFASLSVQNNKQSRD